MGYWKVAAAVVALGLGACGSGGGDSGSSNSGGGNSDLDAAGAVLPRLPGLEMVTFMLPQDLDGDGREDLIMALAPQGYLPGAQVQALMNRPQGFEFDSQYFPAALFSSQDGWIESMVAADLDGDGHADLVLHRDGQAGTAPLLWDPQAQLFRLAPDPHGSFSAGLLGFVAVDADHDGDLDLLGRSSPTAWFLLENDGQGVFTRHATPLFTVQTDSYFFYHPQVLDIDGDGRSDLLFGGPAYQGGWVDQPQPLVVMLNGASGWTQADPTVLFNGDAAEFTHLRLAAKGDFNGDGHMDVALGNHGYDAGGMVGEYNGVLLADGMGGFQVDTQSSAHNYRGFTHAMAAGDLDQDGDLDLVYVDITGADVDYRSKIRLLHNDGQGHFTSTVARFSHAFAMQNGTNWTAAVLMDVDGDSYPDLVLGAMDGYSDSGVFFNDGYGRLR